MISIPVKRAIPLSTGICTNEPNFRL